MLSLRPLFGVLLAVCLTAAVANLRAHTVYYQGTVVTVEAARIHVNTIDEKTKKEERIWFAVDKDTKVKRGDKSVKFDEAAIKSGERIVVGIEHEGKVKFLATEIRLAEKGSSRSALRH
jgi:helix-turn-helix protein